MWKKIVAVAFAAGLSLSIAQAGNTTSDQASDWYCWGNNGYRNAYHGSMMYGYGTDNQSNDRGYYCGDYDGHHGYGHHGYRGGCGW